MQEKQKEIYIIVDGRLEINVHLGQNEILESSEKIILALCGTQSGKTTIGPLWLYTRILKFGAGDYAGVSPTFALMELKLIPEFRRFFEDMLKLGKYYTAPIRKFVFSKEGLRRTFGDDTKPCVVYFGYAENPDSLESSTYKAVWGDEAGQKKFKLDSHDALQRRLAVNQGPVLYTTTPYEFNWMKSRIHDKAGVISYFDKTKGTMVREVRPGGDPNIKVVRFESTMNPAFPEEEFERQRNALPPWKFDMMYRAIWRRPAGTIYDCFIDKLVTDPNEKGHLCRPFAIPKSWTRVIGIDFGNVNLAAAFFAIDPATGNIYLYRTYHTGAKSAKQHVASLLSREDGVPIAVGGAPSEEEWRDLFSRAGLPVYRPTIDGVEEGIEAVYEAFKSGRLFVFSSLDKVIDDFLSYARELDKDGEPTEKIEDKHSYHRLDAVRYGLSEIMRTGLLGKQVIKSKNWDSRQ